MCFIFEHETSPSQCLFQCQTQSHKRHQRFRKPDKIYEGEGVLLLQNNLIKFWYRVSNTSRKNLDGKPNSLKERSHIKSQENFNVDNTLPFCCRRVHKLDGP